MPFLFGVFDFWAFALVSDFDVWVSDFLIRQACLILAMLG
jgi:hypothetical protein